MLRSTDSEQMREEREREERQRESEKRETCHTLGQPPCPPKEGRERENEDMEAGGNKIMQTGSKDDASHM